MDTLPTDLPRLPDEPGVRPRWRTRAALGLSLAMHVLLLLALAAIPHGPVSWANENVLRIALQGTAAPAPATPVLPPPATVPPPVAIDAPSATPATSTPVAPSVAPAAATTPAARNDTVASPPMVSHLDVAMIEVVRDDYLEDLNRHLRGKPVVYPEEARRRGASGRTLVEMSLDRAGNVTALYIAESSGDPALDAAALETLRKAAPFPPPPDALPWEEVGGLLLPVFFRLQ